MVWVFVFFYKWISINVLDIKKYLIYVSVVAVDIVGYVLYCAFYDGSEQKGFFMHKDRHKIKTATPLYRHLLNKTIIINTDTHQYNDTKL